MKQIKSRIKSKVVRGNYYTATTIKDYYTTIKVIAEWEGTNPKLSGIYPFYVYCKRKIEGGRNKIFKAGDKICSERKTDGSYKGNSFNLSQEITDSTIKVIDMESNIKDKLLSDIRDYFTVSDPILSESEKDFIKRIDNQLGKI